MHRKHNMGDSHQSPSSFGTALTFLKKGTCSQTSCAVLNSAFGHPLAMEELAAMRFAGGLMRYGYQCGLIWGATLAAGAHAYHQYGAGPRAEAAAVSAARRLVQSFREHNREHMNCLEITELDRAASSTQMITFFLLKGGTIGCIRRAARYARTGFGEIKGALSEDLLDTIARPVSCATILARKLGASDLHAVMVAGFAGGIGLSGGACGALGAAIWLNGLDQLKKNTGKLAFEDSHAAATIDRFLRCTGYEFECSKIAGRTFECPGDLAAHLNGGGCSRILDVLADSRQTG